MKLTLLMNLTPTPKQHQALLETLVSFNESCNDIAEAAHQNSLTNKWALHRLIPELPETDYSGIRKRILILSVDPYRHLSESTEPVTIALDSTSQGGEGRRLGRAQTRQEE